MKLSRKCEYALLILSELSRHYGDGSVVSAAELSEKNNIPPKFLSHIIRPLKQDGYVESVRGINGGYRLGKNPGDINLAEIVRLIDGPIAPIASVSEFFYQQTPSEQNDKLLACFRQIRNDTVRTLESTTFDRLI